MSEDEQKEKPQNPNATLPNVPRTGTIRYHGTGQVIGSHFSTVPTSPRNIETGEMLPIRTKKQGKVK